VYDIWKVISVQKISYSHLHRVMCTRCWRKSLLIALITYNKIESVSSHLDTDIDKNNCIISWMSAVRLGKCRNPPNTVPCLFRSTQLPVRCQLHSTPELRRRKARQILYMQCENGRNSSTKRALKRNDTFVFISFILTCNGKNWQFTKEKLTS